MTALTFLEVNGATLEYDTKDLETLVIQIAEGKAHKPLIAAFFQQSHQKTDFAL